MVALGEKKWARFPLWARVAGAGAGAAIGLLLYVLAQRLSAPTELAQMLAQEVAVCPLADYVRPDSYVKDNSTVVRIISDEVFRNQSARKLSGAVRIKTDTFDDSPLVEDDPEYWEAKFKPFHEYLASTFPAAWQFLEVETVNSWGLLLTWTGLDPTKQPIVLAAHQDVVPTQPATLKYWTHPPYDGVYDGERLWGRGAADCKNLLVGLLELAELLHENGFRPKRTIIYSFGFDEEIGGYNGARTLAQRLLDRYGPNSVYAVVDEGGQSLIAQDGVILALPGTGEKGSVDVTVGLNTPGGHSSVPPDHTSIGILSEVVLAVEAHAFTPVFTPKNPTFHEYQCIAKYSPQLNSSVRDAILRAGVDPDANRAAREYVGNISLTNRYLISTSSAVDIIHGGAKVNALPEYSEAVINHRVAVESSVAATLQHDVDLVLQVAEKYDLGVVLGDDVLRDPTAYGHFTISHDKLVLEPAPLTPVGDDAWNLFAGTLRHLYEEIAFANKPIRVLEQTTPYVVVAPGMATGNTDTRYYWDLTKHIYRYRPGISPTVETHAHGVDERIPFDSHLQIIAFYYEYLQVVDAI